MGGSGSFRVSEGVVGRLGFRVGVSASYSYFRRVRNFDFVYTAAVSVPLALHNTYWMIQQTTAVYHQTLFPDAPVADV